VQRSLDPDRHKRRLEARTLGWALPGLYKLSISKIGAVSISGTAVGQPITGKIVPAGANRVHINVSIVTPNVYSWRVSGRLLTFAKISESPDVFGRDRSAVMWGVWKRSA
jgi:hypothetical protein